MSITDLRRNINNNINNNNNNIYLLNHTHIIITDTNGALEKSYTCYK